MLIYIENARPCKNLPIVSSTLPIRFVIGWARANHLNSRNCIRYLVSIRKYDTREQMCKTRSVVFLCRQLGVGIHSDSLPRICPFKEECQISFFTVGKYFRKSSKFLALNRILVYLKRESENMFALKTCSVVVNQHNILCDLT